MATRVSHIQRFYRKNEDGSFNTDMWLDVEVLDKLVFEEGSGWRYQRTVYSFFPRFTASRTRWKRRIISPLDGDPDNPTIYVDVPANLAVRLVNGSGWRYQRETHAFSVLRSNAGRTYYVRRIIHYDVDIDTATDTNEFGPFWLSVDDYLNALSNANVEDYVDVEVPAKVTHAWGSGHKYQRTRRSYFDNRNNPLLANPLRPDLVDKVEADDPGDPGEINPPWRLDPLLNIVNCSFGAFYAVEFDENESLYHSPLASESPPLVEDNGKMVMSMWFRLKNVTPDPDGAILFQKYPTVQNKGLSSITLHNPLPTSEDDHASLRIFMAGTDSGTDGNIELEFNLKTNPGEPFDLARWYHLLFAIDTENILYLDNSLTPYYETVLTGNQTSIGGKIFYQHLVPSPTPWTFYAEGTSSLWGIGTQVTGDGVPQDGGVLSFDPGAASQQFYRRKVSVYLDDVDAIPNLSVNDNRQTGVFFNRFNNPATLPDATLLWEDMEIGVPLTKIYVDTLNSPTTQNPVIELAEVQIWTNQSLDLSNASSRRLFSYRRPADPNTEGDVERLEPVDPDTGKSIYGQAEDAPAPAEPANVVLGPPAYSFRRNSAKQLKFEDNHGSGGGFTLSDPIVDFKPDPKVDLT